MDLRDKYLDKYGRNTIATEREEEGDLCPFGGGRCGVGPACPLHDKLVDVQQAMDRLLHETTFAEFKAPEGKTPTPTTRSKRRRESYRAPRSASR